MNQPPLMPGYTQGSMQWRAKTLQVVNWGGFHGHVTVDLADGATLVSGASGAGKSTLLDAWTALMMPANVAFNGASNDATTGRARGVDQRNVLTYLRGKRDVTLDTATGVATDQVMRGESRGVWGAVAMTFVNDQAEQFTAMRIYVASQAARLPGDVRQRLVTVPDAFDLRGLDQFRGTIMEPRRIRGVFANVEFHESYTKFSHVLFAKLGIGAGGDGSKALRLLSRIQAGHQVRTVDKLYKDMVLERPVTFDKADDALGQFNDLEATYSNLEVDGRKERLLRPIKNLHAEYHSAAVAAERLDTYQAAGTGDTPFSLWAARCEYQVLAAEISENREQARAVAKRVADAKQQVAALRTELVELQDQQRNEGGGAIEAADAKIASLAALRGDREQARKELEHRLGPIGVKITDADAFADQLRHSEQHVAGADQEQESLLTARDAVVADRAKVQERLDDLRDEATSLTQRHGLVPRDFHEARLTIAEACGLEPDDLPFAAELMDVHPDWEDWRLAAEVTLANVGLTLLMDDRKQQMIRETLETLTLRRRINFTGVDLSVGAATPTDTDYLSGRLVFADSPFAAWVRHRVTASGVDHLCVDSAAELGGSEAKVTVNGQVSRGARGSYGHNPNNRWILGFSNTSRVADVADQAKQLMAELAALTDKETQIREDIAAAATVVEAHRVLLNTSWDTLDLDDIEQQQAEATAHRESLIADDSPLTQVAHQCAVVEQRSDTARNELAFAQRERTELDSTHGALVDRQERADRLVEKLQADEACLIADTDLQHLDDSFAEQEPDVCSESLKLAVRRFRNRLVEESEAARALADARRGELCRVFAQYQDAWPDPNRGVDIESYPEYVGIYDHITEQGLYQRRDEFKRKVAQWSGQDLVALNDAFEQALFDIEDRMDPVNEILRTLPFGAERDRLRIVFRRLRTDAVTKFRKQLKALSEPIADELSDEQAEAAFVKLRDFMALIDDADPANAKRREDLLDVRRHVEVTACRVNSEGQEVSSYSTLGGKSGGETQELVAFIVGAALRFQLGDDTRTRPRFAPVFLDEGFVKADGEFAGRAVNAWQGLGFQLIVSVPLDKVTALEPYMDLRLSVTKDHKTGYSFVQPLVEVTQ